MNLSSMAAHKDDRSCKKNSYITLKKIKSPAKLAALFGESFKSFVCVGVRKSYKIIISKSMLCNIQSPFFS
jgi:hypothetical protein